MIHHLTRQCISCGSTTMLVEDSRQSFEQPDGFLPFKLDEGQATLALGKAQHSTAQRLRTWWVGHEQEFTRLQLGLLPVWVGLAQRDDECRLVLVNGQTGKVVFSSLLSRRSKE